MLGIKPRASCKLDKHSVNQAIYSPNLKSELGVGKLLKAPLEFLLSPFSLHQSGSSPASSFGHAELGIKSIMPTVPGACANGWMIYAALTSASGNHKEDSDYMIILVGTE